MKFIISLYFIVCSVFASDLTTIATVDSGFGGYFSTKAIEERALYLSQDYQTQFQLKHYGDTLHAPYGEKSPEEIARYAAQVIIKAHQDGAEHVFLACNTASSQFALIQKILNSQKSTAAYANTTYSIIQISIEKLASDIKQLLDKKDQIDIAILSTPATLKSGVYPKALQDKLKLHLVKSSAPIILKQKRWYQKVTSEVESIHALTEYTLLWKKHSKQVRLYQIAPGNWVEMIEHQASQTEKMQAVDADLSALFSAYDKPKLDVVAEFCTHFPALHQSINKFLQTKLYASNTTDYIQQGELVANLFQHIMLKELAKHKRTKPLNSTESDLLRKQLTPEIFLSGDNKTETINLVKTLFPEQQDIKVEHFQSN